MAEKISVLIAEDEINNRIQEMADELAAYIETLEIERWDE